MDPALRKEKEAFIKRALGAADKSQKLRIAANKSKASLQSSASRKSTKGIGVLESILVLAFSMRAGGY